MNAYPLTQKYDPAWVEEHWMGPNPLCLAEELCKNMDLRPGMRVLDMGCGKGLTSIFLAKEYGVTVFANDLWIDATENWQRFQDAGVADRVFPIHAEAHALPYAEGFFDAAVSIDSYHYYGADEMYFPCTFAKLVKPGGQFGIVVPGFTHEFERGFPDALEPLWIPEMFSFHSGAWWRKLWEKTGMAAVTACYDIPGVKDLWKPWADWAKIHMDSQLDLDFLAADTNDELAFIAMTAQRT